MTYEDLIFASVLLVGALIVTISCGWGGFYLVKRFEQDNANARARAEAKVAALNEAKHAYESALEELEADNSTENKKKALESGREYAALSREAHQGDKSVTLFDEVALTNDINARIK